MSKSKFKVVVIILSMVIITGIIYIINTPHNNEKRVNTAHADWVEHYKDFNSLKENSDLIITGKKVDSYTEKRVDMIFTKEIIQIDKVYYGDLEEDTKIEILQTGGTMDNIETKPLEEAPILDDNGEYLLFLRSTEEDHYLILGRYQGVGQIKNGKVVFYKHNTEISKELKGKSLYDIEELITN